MNATTVSVPMPEEPTRIWNNRFLCVFLANALMYLGQYMVQTLVTKYASTLGATQAVLGIVASAFALTALIFKFFSGPAIDAFERKYVIFTFMLVLSAAFLGYSFATSVKMVIGIRLLQGCAQAFTATGYLAMATDALPRDKIGSGLGVFTLAQSICMAISPTIGLAIANRFGFPTTFVVASAMVFIAALFSLRIKPSGLPRRKFQIRPGSIIAREALLPCAFLVLIYTSACLVNSYLVIYATETCGVASIGAYFVVNTCVMFVTRPLVGRLTDKYGFTKIFVPALICFALAYFIISFSNSLWMFLLAAVISAFGNGVCHPLVNALCMKSVPKERRGAGSSTSYVGVDIGNLIGPSLAAMIVTKMGYNAMWRVMTVPIFIAMALALVLSRRIAAVEARGANAGA